MGSSFDQIDRLCRLCGTESQDLIHLFENQCGERNLVAIIKKYVRVIVSNRDALPHHVCGPCVAKLDEVVEFVDTSLATQAKFRKLFEADNASGNKVKLSEDRLYEIIQDVKVELKETEDDAIDDDLDSEDSSPRSYKRRAASARMVRGRKKPVKGCIGKLIKKNTENLKGLSSCKSELGELHISDDVDSPDAVISQKVLQDETNRRIKDEDGTTDDRLSGAREAVSSSERLEVKSRCPMRCHFCEATFHSSEELTSHVIEVHKSSDVKFMCPQCPETFLKLNSMTSHQKRKHRDTLQSCPKCKKLYPAHYLWTRHMLVHTNTRPFTCDECDKKFKSKAELYNHKRTHKPSEERYTHCCELCGKRFTQKANLESHLRLHTGRRPFSCEFCDKSFSQRGNMEEHRRIHTGETPYVCDICGTKYRRQGQLTVHQKQHKGEKPHKCRFCDKQFLRKQVLQKHEHVHTDTRPYKCSFCEKSFRDQGKRKVHERLHTGERPYVCQYCNRGFCESGNLKKHLRVHMNYHVKHSSSEPSDVQGGPNKLPVEATVNSTTFYAHINAGSAQFTNECVKPSQILPVPESLAFTAQGSHLSSNTTQTLDSSVPLQIGGPVSGNTLITHRPIDEANRKNSDREEEYRVSSSVPLQSVNWASYQT
ncbi:zinc finger protein 525-like isoform X1 [Macrobrachium nipponense]|uniref:zinc finger protein 525-like isoform X1 n=1 Tax=Macrobrachium nipponense TaxID=159736 RepID=UPI0030C87C1D